MSAEPREPVVDLPRVQAAQFQHYDHTVGAYLVTAADDMAMWVDQLCSAAPTTVAADIETRGLDANKFSITCVTVAFKLGVDTVALLFDPLRRAEHGRVLRRVFDHAREIIFHGATFDVAPLYAHRLLTREHIRKVGDTLVASRMVHTYAKAGRSLEELATTYGVMDDDRTSMSEVFSIRGLKKDDGWWKTDIDTPTYCVGAMSDTVATLRLWGTTPGAAGEGIMATAARYLTKPELGLGGLGGLDARDAEQVVEDVQQVNRIVLERTARGYAVDSEFPQRFLNETSAETKAAAHTLTAAKIRPGVGKDLVNVLAARGELPQPWPTTPTGQLKSDKAALEVFTAEDAIYHSDLVLAHRKVATAERVNGYLEKVLENAGPTGRLHPEVKILGASATGRMCLPTDHQLLTRRGIVPVDEIRSGDRTLDADGNWTTVRSVHRYVDAPVRTYLLGDGTFLKCTPEHRWVTVTPRGETVLQTLDEAARVGAFVQLAPPRVDNDTYVDAAQSDDPAVLSAWATGMAVMDEARQAYRIESDVYEEVSQTMTICARREASAMVEKLRERRSLAVAESNRESGVTPSQPLHWALAASVPELLMLLGGAGLLCARSGEEPLHSFEDHWLQAILVAFYRIGTPVRAVLGGAVIKGLGDLFRVTRRTAAETQNVWCVTTDSGTFTAWGERGPYLTGNSASKPEIQQFPKEARGVIVSDGGDWVSADWKSIEPVVLATASGDRQFLADMREGKDPYEPVGQMAGIDRKLAKRKMLADMYGQGHAAAALQYGWSLDEAKRVAWAIRDGLPILYKLIDALKRQSGEDGHVRTLTGRVVNQDFTFTKDGVTLREIAKRIAPNHFCQGTALDIMHHSILELDRRGLSEHVHLWMHDEIVADATISAELAEVMSTPPPFLQAAARLGGMDAFLAVDVNGMGPRWEYV